MKKEANYIPNKMKVVEVRSLSPEVKGLKLIFANSKEGHDFSFKPGQFALISRPGFEESTFAITSSAKDLPFLEITIKSVGEGTRALHRLQKGDELWLRGPLGLPLPLEEFIGKEVLLIGGGIGLAPLRSVILFAKDNPQYFGNIKLLYGAKTPNHLLYKTEMLAWSKDIEIINCVDHCDAEWKGAVGQIPKHIRLARPKSSTSVIICGPPSMLSSTIKALKTEGVKEENIFLMLERRLKCGIGKCQHCTCGDKYICLDGPSFSLLDLRDNFEANELINVGKK